MVALGQHVDNIDILFAPVPMATISGTVVDSEGRPVIGATVVLSAAGVLDPSPRATDTGLNSRGNEFRFTAVAPGRYDLRATFPPLGLRAASTVSINGQDYPDIVLSPIQLARATGRVAADAGIAQSLPFSSIVMGSSSTNYSDPASWNAGTARVAPDLTFSVPVLPGPWRLTSSLPSGWRLKAVRIKGVDVTDSGVLFEAGVEVPDVEVILTNQQSIVSGIVRDSNGDLVSDCTVLVFSTDRERRRIENRYFAHARPDQRAQFLVNSLAPGEYYVVALEYVSVDEMQNPDLLDQLATVAATLSVREGESTNLELLLTR